MLLPFLVSRHQHLASAASDNDFVTPEPRHTARSARTTCRQANTQQRIRKKKPKIVFSSDESSEEGMAGLEGAQLGGWGLVSMGSCCVDSLPTIRPTPTPVVFLPIVWTLFCSVAGPVPFVLRDLLLTTFVTQLFLVPPIIGIELSAEMTEDETPKKTTPIRRASTRKHRS